MIPLVKAWCSDLGFEIASESLQVHGGMGYIEETGAAQHVRDARINMIYEGTNGVQALDLVGRKLAAAEGKLPWDLSRNSRPTSAGSKKVGMVPWRARCGRRSLRSGRRPPGCSRIMPIMTMLRPAPPPICGCSQPRFGGFLLARSALVAKSEASDQAQDKLEGAVFFASQLLPPAVALLPAITAGSAPLKHPLEAS